MKHIFILIAVLMPLLGIAQKEDYVWVMGNNIIDFNTTPPTVRANGDFGPKPGLTSISDCDGNLVYWLNGVNLYNKNSELINTDGRITVSDWLAGMTIFPFPGSENKYIFIYLEKKAYNDIGTIHFTVIDGSKDILHPELIRDFATLPYNNSTPIFIQKKNSRDFWLLHQDDDMLVVYSFTKDGLSLISKKNLPMENDEYFILGGIYGNDVSRSQTKIYFYEVSFWENDITVYLDFDNVNGIINDITVHQGKGEVYLNWVFTSNERFFYFTLYENKTERNNKIFRCPVEKLKEKDALRKYRSLVYQFPAGQFIEALKMGPDGNIYFINGDNEEYIGVISNPEDDNPNVNPNGIKLAQTSKTDGWAAMFPYTYHYPFGLSYTRDCHDFTFSFSESEYESVVWNFGDGTAEVKDVEKPTHTFAADGKYTVNLTVTLTDGIVREYSTEVGITTPKMPRIIVEE